MSNLTADEQGACAHRRVMYRTDDSLENVTRGWWECTMCDQRFSPTRPYVDHGAPVALSKREHLAAMAMQGLAPRYCQGSDFMEDHVAEGAVKLADALLKELAK